MKIAIVQFPGSNCERETMLAVQRAGMTPVEVLWNEPVTVLAQMDGFIIVGGFSYEDRSRAGIIAAMDPIMQAIKQQSELGKPVLGICNGAQILVEAGLVPGLDNNQLGMALTENKRIVDGKILGTGFYNAWIHMRTCAHAKPNAFTRCVNNESVLTVPAAHAEGRFVLSDELLAEVIQQGLGIFQYCDEQGEIDENFPINPNGSMNNIAAVLNKQGNVMAMMPHPERTQAGDAIFHSMREYITQIKEQVNTVINYTPCKQEVDFYQPKAAATELIVKLIITDNSALTVQNSLKQLGLSIKVTRLMHWQVDTKDTQVIDLIKQSGLLYNDRKEYLVNADEMTSQNTSAYLVRSHEDMVGQEKKQMLQDHFSLSNVPHIHHGILWIFTYEDDNMGALNESILNSHIIANPYAHKVYEYAGPL